MGSPGHLAAGRIDIFAARSGIGRAVGKEVLEGSLEIIEGVLLGGLGSGRDKAESGA